MKRLEFSDEEIISILKEVESGMKVQATCQKYGISDTTFYKWRSKYGMQNIPNERRLKQLEAENQRLKSIVADLTLRNQALKRVVSKKW